jgi:Ca2+-binding RTX toxin-like protein
VDESVGGLGNDTLTGGAGLDSFFFTTALNAATNGDTITDFNVTDDTIRIDNAIFTAFNAVAASTMLASAAFKANATGTATEGDDRIVYNTTPAPCSTTRTVAWLAAPCSSRPSPRTPRLRTPISL